MDDININQNINPLQVSIKKGVIDGKMMDLMSYDEYVLYKDVYQQPALYENVNGTDIALPCRENYSENSNLPGIYNAGPIDFIVYPNKENIDKYIPERVVEMNNNMSVKEVIKAQSTIQQINEPYITTPDKITTFNIDPYDEPEMKGLKEALNDKAIDFDSYGKRFGVNFPNDKRGMNQHSATIKVLKRFGKNCDMDILLTFRDKNEDVPNPMGKEVTISLITGEFEE